MIRYRGIAVVAAIWLTIVSIADSAKQARGPRNSVATKHNLLRTEDDLTKPLKEVLH